MKVMIISRCYERLKRKERVQEKIEACHFVKPHVPPRKAGVRDKGPIIEFVPLSGRRRRASKTRVL